MNKKIKRIIATTLAVSAICAIEPVKYLNLITTKAYASDDRTYLKDIDISKGSLRFSKKTSSYSTKVSSSVEEITVSAETVDNDDRVTIDGSDISVSNCKAEKIVGLSRGKNRIRVRVESADGDPNTYYINVTRGSSSSNDDHHNNDSDDDAYLDNIKLSEGDIKFSKKKTSYNIGVGASVSEIRITAEPNEDYYDVEIDGTTVDDGDKYRKSVKLSNGKNTIKIKVVDDDDNDRTYTLNIYRGTTAPSDVSNSSNNEDEDAKGDIYLDDLLIDDGDIKVNFKPKETSYSVDVNESHDSIIIKAEPEDDEDIVRIDDNKVDSSNRKRVYLNKGKNVIKINIHNDEDKDDDDYEERTYTLTVYRGTSQGSANTSTSESTNISTSTSSETKTKQWVSVNGRWQYNDDLGNPLKNTWYFDRNLGQTYYLKDDGYMATGWLLNDNTWYYLNQSGLKQTGWFKDWNGKWYYLYQSGAMACNTTVNGYKIGSDGAWTN